MATDRRDRPALRTQIQDALGSFADGPLRERAEALLEVLGYRSERHIDVDRAPLDFLKWAETDSGRPLTAKQRALILETWERVEMVFQYSEDELKAAAQNDLFGASATWTRGRAESFVFFAVDLKPGDYTRSKLAAMTRAINRFFPMPAIVFYRHERPGGGVAVTLAVTHRRVHRRDTDKDVLDRTTLIKDIDVRRPHRAHIDILDQLALDRLDLLAVSFDRLHLAWERVLDTEELGRRFYTRLFEWFERAVFAVRFPDDDAGAGSDERNVIRMITRLLFIWFLKEKRLVPEAVFTEAFAARTLRNHGPDDGGYYRAVLQNLFFATLNTPIEKRAFSQADRSTHRDFAYYRYRDLLADPDDFVKQLASVPFVNGGLFDCLDTFANTGAGGTRIDVFTDNRTHREQLHVPSGLFLNPEHGLFPLLNRYKFTVEENTPLDQEVALDPELLGKAFENLLAAYNPETREHARKATGSYYTPRKVVDYMVDEALAAHIAAAVPPHDGDRGWLDERLRHLLAINQGEGVFGGVRRSGAQRLSEDHLIHEAEIDPLIDAINDLRVLDPACGSGAFPMGVLQKLVMVLGKVDPENQRWKARQIATARRIADPSARRSAIQAVEDAFSPERGYGDYGRKLYLIQRVIHGVDIQPIATQIAKLRFFISLIIEQMANDDAESNFGIEALPNLETCFVAADTLKRLRHSGQKSLNGTTVQDIEEELEALRSDWFDARDRDEKWEIRKRAESLRRSLAAALIENEWDADEAQALAEWDIYDQNSQADWFDSEWMFGIKSGFDIVIGNPPYVQLQKRRGELANRYQGERFRTFTRSADVYVLFCERGADMLADRGVLSFITSNSWLRAKYGRGLRRMLADSHTPLRLVELGKDVFDNAIVDSSVLIARTGGVAKPFPGVDVEHLDANAEFPEIPEDAWGEVRPAGGTAWGINSRAEWGVMDRMLEVGTPLGEWDGIAIRRGVLTGLNAAFIIDEKKRAELIVRDPKSAEIIKPILRGRDVGRWRARACRWLIDAHNGYGDVPPVDVAAYPAVRAHLDRHRPRLVKRQDQGVTPYNLRSCAYYEEFLGEKLFWMDMTERGRFALAEEEMFCNNAGYMISGGRLGFLGCVLNSSLAAWFVKRRALTSGMGVLRWFRVLVESIPVPVPSDASARLMDTGVRRILAAKDADPDADVSQLEAEVDRMVYGLYGLTEEQVGLVEGVGDRTQ